ncbi:electron transfer flavoprotein subunit alpha/FixB family protein [Aromatoleum evansii]|uniref:electron transfer flavoprotein subunit alpha n=1 Tax=Aromatoleum evansii TaxID=59406 RepID=UPI00145E812E|nr:electron transfer flavoprotein subunit alpha/FixB family protein [Aromatoleum evansii]NMG30207.1 electron transfer flavoprotein subunit alpha/FixB family protein [Aromatoleum evansii]
MSDIIRRDPRREHILRNRLHPDHGVVLALVGGALSDAARWIGPSGLVRRNPHAVGFIGPNGLRRIDRSGAPTSGLRSAAKSEAASDSRREVVISEPAFYIAVVADLPGGRLSAHDRDLLGLARQLADAERDGAVLLLAFGELRDEGLGDSGVDRVLEFKGGHYDGYGPEARLATLFVVERDLRPRHWIFPESTLGGGELGRRLAARLGVRPATQVWQIADGRCTGRGAAGATDITRALPSVVLALPECGEPVTDTRHAATPLAVTAAVALPLRRVEDLGAVAVDPAGVALAEAEFILSAGNGITDWDGFHHAAKVLGAAEGASRVAVDNGFMPRHRQVGATGTWVTARVYLAAGISGAIQHLQGIQSCEKVVAINTDPGCDMVKRADLAVIGNAGEVLGELVKLIGKTQGERRDVAA